MDTTKLTRLTPGAVNAVERAAANGFLSEGTKVTRTTATLPGSPRVAFLAVRRAISEMDALEFHGPYRKDLFLVYTRLFKLKEQS